MSWLRELGYTNAEIAEGCSMSQRQVRDIFQKGNVHGDALVELRPGVVPREKLAAEYQAMLDDTVEAFEAFYNRFAEFDLPAHCREWVEDYLDHNRLLLNVPPRHNKSTVFSIWIPVWELVKDRNNRILIVSRTSTLAVQWVAHISFLLRSTEIPLIFGRFAPDKNSGDIPWRPSKGELMVVGRSDDSPGQAQFSVLARGSGNQILGFSATRIIIDDCTDRQTAISEAQRDQEKDWLLNDVMTRLQPGARAVVVGQRVHIMDLYGFLQEMKQKKGRDAGKAVWQHIVYPAISRWPEGEDDSGAECLWPELWPYDELMERYNTMGEQAFECMYQQEPLPASASLVRDEWLQRCRDYDRKLGMGFRKDDPTDRLFPVSRVMSIDPSPTKYNGLIIADVFYSREQFYCFIIEVDSFIGDLRRIKEKISSKIAQYKPDYFIFEKNIVQEWLRGDPFFEAIREYVRVLPHTTNRNKGDEEWGMESLGADFEFQRISLPYGDDAGQKSSAILENEARAWTREGRVRDDTLMALWFIKWNYKKLAPLRELQDHFDGTAGTEHWYRKQRRTESDAAAAWREQRRQARARRERVDA
jgi:hypothetical protein